MPLIAGALARCALIVHTLVGHYDAQYVDRVLVCADVLSQAVQGRVDPPTAIAVAWQESRFTRPPPNPWNCAGPLQVKVHYWCANVHNEWSLHRADGVLDGCDLVDAGVRALRYYAHTSVNDYDMLCRYGWGRCDSPTRRRYVQHTLQVASRVRALLGL